MHLLSRRAFLIDSALGAAAVAVAGSPVLAAAEKVAKKTEANDTLHVAVVGVHGRGMSHVGGFLNKNLNTVITHVCDCDSGVINKAMTAIEKGQGHAPKFEQDFRKLLDDKTIDIISIATPNHWHSLMAIWAMQAGKDVYVEKPVSHNVSEGRRAVEAARRYNRICQAGTQCRSMAGTRAAMDFLRKGKLGKITLARGLCYKSRPSIGRVKGEQEPPSTMDYDLWCGPAPLKKPHHRSAIFGTVHYDWHWFWDYGNGDLGNQGIHQMDVARWGLGKNELAKSVVSVGGRFGYVDDGETPNTQVCVFDYGDSELIFEVRGLPTKHLQGARVGNVFYGNKGYLVCPGYDSAVAYHPDGQIMEVFKGGDDHFGNFVKAVRSRKKEELNADILEGHLSSALCHLGNVSYRLGAEQPLSKQSHAFGDDKAAYETLARMEEHLKENKVPPDGTTCHVGRRLSFDPQAERFVNDSEADALLTREYRKPFVVPEKV
jgi:predicted dehydrogenase